MSGVGENVLHSGVDQTSHVDRQTDRQTDVYLSRVVNVSPIVVSVAPKSFLTLRRHA